MTRSTITVSAYWIYMMDSDALAPNILLIDVQRFLRLDLSVVDRDNVELFIAFWASQCNAVADSCFKE